jgi:hypothetical protein
MLQQAAEPGVVDALGGGRLPEGRCNGGVVENRFEQAFRSALRMPAMTARSSPHICSGSRRETGRKSSRSTSVSGRRWSEYMVSWSRFW